jgi:hypothetical protein
MKFFFVTLMAMGMVSAFCVAEGTVVGDGEKRIAISDLDLGLMRVGYGKPLANQSLGGGPLSINGVTFKTGIATHAVSDFTLALDGKAMSFQAICGIDDDSRHAKASVRFSIAADGKTVWTSPVMKGGIPGAPVQIPLAGVRLLRLSVDDAGDGISSDHADWADAAIFYRGEPPAAIAPPQPPLRWSLGTGNTTVSKIPDTNVPHRDFIEQGGRRAGQKVWYTINADSTLTIERDLVWPSLRIFPNDTHGSFIRHYGAEAEPKITVDGVPLGPVKYTEALLDGTLSFIGSAQSINVKRVTFPCFEKYAALDRWTLVNSGSRPVTIAVAPIALSAEQKGPYGINVAEVSCDAPATTRLEPGQSITITVFFSARPKESSAVPLDAEKEEKGRREFISLLSDTLVLETPDAMLNRAFTFAKWRVAEAMNDTRGGLMLAPGNLRYYAATWCNDNVEYAGPFFPFLGEAGGNQGSLNAYRQYMAFMKPTYQRIPCSIVAEGTSTWGPFDRGDAAMYAYGASRFALALGDRAIAEELWKGIEWSLEYCKRQQTPEGVIASDKDELEGRLPAGKANLTTASLCYGALRSAADLARSLQRVAIATEYDQRADLLATAIETYFGATVEGFSTYRYYDGNTQLRSWICMPLSMGIFNRKEGTFDALFSPRMWTPDGLASQSGDKVFWDRSTLYALRAVFQAGETTKALDYLTRYTQRRLLGEHVPYAVEAFPEGGQGHLASESGLYCRIFIEGLFGILPTGLNTFRCTPRLPDNWPSMSLKHIKAFGGDFDMIVTRADAKLRVQVIQAGHSLFDQVINPGESYDVIEPQPDRNKK